MMLNKITIIVLLLCNLLFLSGCGVSTNEDSFKLVGSYPDITNKGGDALIKR